MTTKISNVTTVVNIESVYSGFVFKGTVEIYSNLQVIKKINCRVSEEGAVSDDPLATPPEWQYIVTRGCYAENYACMGGNLPEGPLGKQILSAGIEFEAMLNDRIQAGTLNDETTI